MPREDGPRAVAEIVARQRRGPRAEERPGALRARDGGGPRRRGDAPGGARGAAAGVPHGHAPVPVRAFVEGFRGWGRALRRAVGRWYAAQPVGRARLPGGQVPPARGRDAPRPAAPGPPGAPGGAGNPTLDVSDEHARLFEWIVRGGDDRRPAAPGRGLRPRPGGDARPRRRRRSSASTACRARRSSRST